MRSTSWFFCMFVAFASTTSASLYGFVNAQDDFVHIADGAVRGRVVRTATNRYAQEFLGIPYAKPPVGELRFRPPQPPDKWADYEAHDGTKLGSACVQNSGYILDLLASALMFTLFPARVSEDCLNINVHTPFPMTAQQEKLPVLVWIHGGAFRVLGPLGFFSLKGVEGVSGNQGLLDQALALKWTRNNIEHFGGDPERITIMGVSAGSASVHYHLLSPLSRDLYTNAIMQSGTALSFWSYQTPEHAQQEARWFAENANCLGNAKENVDEEEVLKCLQSKSVQDVMVTTVKVLILHEHHAMFNPTMDGVLIEKPPSEYMSGGDFSRAAVMLGTTNYERSPLCALRKIATIVETGFSQVMPMLSLLYPVSILLRAPAVLLSETQFKAILEKFSDWLNEAPVDAIHFAYRNWSEPKETGAERWRMLNAVADDVFMNNAVVDMLDAYQAHGVQLYRYKFERIASKHLWGFPFGGSAHADDAPFFMGHVLDLRHGYDNDDVELSRRVLHAVSNFMRTSNPNSAADLKGGKLATLDNNWRPYAGHLDYYTIDSKAYGVVQFGPERWRSEFWRRAVPYLHSLGAKSRTKDEELNSQKSFDNSFSQISHFSSPKIVWLQFKNSLNSLVSGVGMKVLWIILPYLPL